MVNKEDEDLSGAIHESAAGSSQFKVGRGRTEATAEIGTPTERAEALKVELFGSDLTVAETAHILDVDRTTVLRYLRDNELFGYQIGREWRIPEQDLRTYRNGLMEARRREVAHAATESRIDRLLPRLNQQVIEDEAPPYAKIWCPRCAGPVQGELRSDPDSGDIRYQGECEWCQERVSERYRRRPRRVTAVAAPPMTLSPAPPPSDSFEDDGDIPF